MVRIIVGLIICSLFFSCGKKEKQVETAQAESYEEAVEAPQEEVVETTVKKEEPTDTAPIKELLKEEKPAEKIKEVAKKSEPAKAKDDISSLSKSELWQLYKSERKKADNLKQKGEFEKSIRALLTAAASAKALQRPDIASWQYNNAGKHAIDAFKASTDYTKRMAKLVKMKHSKEKVAYLADTKKVMREKKKLLDESLDYLQKATMLNKAKPDVKRSNVIQSNLRFIESANKIMTGES